MSSTKNYKSRYLVTSIRTDDDNADKSYYVTSTEINAAARAALGQASVHWFTYDFSDSSRSPEITHTKRLLLDIFNNFFDTVGGGKPAWNGMKWDVHRDKDSTYLKNVRFTLSSENEHHWISVEFSTRFVTVLYSGKWKFQPAMSFLHNASQDGFTEYDCAGVKFKMGDRENAEKLPVDKNWFHYYDSVDEIDYRNWRERVE
jgi:hypothetical protein